jgi:hypothetical protein
VSSVKRPGSETKRALLLACLGWLLACFSPATARAATTIAWHAPPECPNQSHIIQGVETWIGAAITEPRAQELAISGHVSAGTTYAVTIEIVSNEGRSERRLEHVDCARLVEAAELVIALAIDPERVKRRQRELQPPSNAPTAKPTAQPPPESPQPLGEASQPTAASSGPGRDRRATDKASRDAGPWLLSATGLVGGGMLPGVGAGAGLEVGFEWRMLRAGITGSYWLSREVAVAAPRPLSLNLQLAAAGLELCGAWRFSDVRLGPCGRAELGRMTGWGTGVDDARQGHERWSALSLHAAARYPDSARLAGRLLVGAGLSLDRPIFGVTRAGVAERVFQTNDAFWRCALGLELRL